MMVANSGEPSVSGVRSGLLRVAAGVLYGLGFSFAAATVVWLSVGIAKYLDHRPSATNEPDRIWHKRFDATAGMSIESHRPVPTKYNFFGLGSVRNARKDSWESVEVEVCLRDSSGRPLRVCRGLVNGPVRPAQVRDFEVDCHGSEWEPVPNYTTYTIEIVDARYEMDDGT